MKQGGVEVWLLPGFPNYAVGIDGSVWGSRTGRGKECPWRKLRQGTDKDGYKVITLHRHDGDHYCRVARLVLLTFRGPCPPGMEARHLDNDRANNQLSNLEWATPSRNAKDRAEAGTCTLLKRGTDHPQGKLTDAEIGGVLVMLDAGERQAEIASVFGISRGYVAQIKKHRGRDPRRKVGQQCD